MEENDGRVVFINTSFVVESAKSADKDYKEAVDNVKDLPEILVSASVESPYMNMKYSYFFKENKNETIMRADISHFSVDLLYKDTDDKTGKFYNVIGRERNSLDIDVDKKDIGCLIYDRGIVYLKGTFKINYYHLNGGNYQITLSSK